MISEFILQSMIMYTISKEEQIKELTNRIPPILNIDLVIFRRDKWDIYTTSEFLVGKKNIHVNWENKIERIFPWWRMHYEETIEEAVFRILEKEVPGINVKLKKLVTAISDKWYDHRAYGVTLEYLLEYESGVPQTQEGEFVEFKRVDVKEMWAIEHMHVGQLKTLNEAEAAIASMNNTQDEILVQVDKDNNEIGSALKREAHSNPNIYHRAAHIMLFNTSKQVILQQRAPTKATGANRRDMPWWHQTLWQNMEETAHAELLEEMWIETDLKLKRIWLKQTPSQSEYYYLYYGIHDWPYAFDKYEVQKVMAFNCQKLLNHEYDSEYNILHHVYEYVEELKFLRE